MTHKTFPFSTYLKLAIKKPYLNEISLLSFVIFNSRSNILFFILNKKYLFGSVRLFLKATRKKGVNRFNSQWVSEDSSVIEVYFAKPAFFTFPLFFEGNLSTIF